jgi:hypothetical protein
MTDYEREVVRESTTTGTTGTHAHDHVAPAAAADVHTRERIVRPGPTTGEVIRRFVMLLFGVLQALLILRIILLLLVANTNNDVVGFILGITDPFVDPFRGMFRIDEIESGRSQFDVAAVVALIGWTLVEALIIALLSLGARRGEDATA